MVLRLEEPRLLMVRMISLMSPEYIFALEPSFASRPSPSEILFSTSATCGGTDESNSLPLSFSYQRKAGML